MFNIVYSSMNSVLPSTTLPWGLSDASNQSWGTGDKVTKALENVSLATFMCTVPGKLTAHKTKCSKDKALNSALEGWLEQLTSMAAVQLLPADALGLQTVNTSVCKLLRMSFSSLTTRVFPFTRTSSFESSERWFILRQIKDACIRHFSEAQPDGHAMGHALMQRH